MIVVVGVGADGMAGLAPASRAELGTLACARMGWAVQHTEVISLVTADAAIAVRRGGSSVVLSRDASSPAALARLLAGTGRGDSQLTVLEQLGGPRERRRAATAAQWAADPAARYRRPQCDRRAVPAR